MIKHLPVKHLYILNQISTNKVFDTKSTNKIYCLNNSTNNLTKTTRIKAFNKTYNKTFISYNHFKGSKRDFNYKSYKSIKNGIFWLKSALKGFKISTNKIVRLKIYKYSLVKIILLISSFCWSEILARVIPDKFTKDCRSPEIWGIFEPHFRLGNFTKDFAKS